jgi:ferredoxin
MTIFYFTGTGNSLFVARKIADGAGANLISIPQAIQNPQTYSSDCIGFVYPQYADGLPKMVRSFVLSNVFEADYVFALDLYSFIHIYALREMAGIIPISYGAYIKTPFNFIHMFNSTKNPSALLAKTEQRLEKIIADIKSRKKNNIKPRKAAGNATKYFGEAKMQLTDSCKKCGTCVSVCPANNIKIGDSLKFGNNCENCSACMNLCSEHAIYSNNASLKRQQYRNPFVSINDISEANHRS